MMGRREWAAQAAHGAISFKQMSPHARRAEQKTTAFSPRSPLHQVSSSIRRDSPQGASRIRQGTSPKLQGSLPIRQANSPIQSGSRIRQGTSPPQQGASQLRQAAPKEDSQAQTRSPALVAMTARAAKFGVHNPTTYQHIRQLAAPNIGTGGYKDVWAMAYHSPRQVAHQLTPFTTALTPIVKNSLTPENPHRRPPDAAAHMLDMALGTAETAIRLLEDAVPARLDAATNWNPAANQLEPMDLTCICPCCNKDFQLKAMNYAEVGTCREGDSNEKHDLEDLQQEMQHAREMHRMKIEEELYEFSAAKLKKVLNAFTRTQSQILDRQLHPGRDVKKQQYLALYEELLQEKHELEMTTMLQQKMDGTSDAQLRVVSVPPGMVKVPPPTGGQKVPAMASRVDARALRINLPRAPELLDADLSPREVTRISPKGRRVSPRSPVVTPRHAMSRDPAVISARQLTRVSPRERMSPHEINRTVVPLSSPRADPQIRVFKHLDVGDHMYPEFRYSGHDAAPGFTPSARSGANTPLDAPLFY